MSLDFCSKDIEVSGEVKWFDAARGFGFVVPNAGDADVLLHENILKNFGMNSISAGSKVEMIARHSDHGFRAVEVCSITPPSETIEDHARMVVSDFDPTELVPARIKWFSISKGYGFANAYGHKEDIFVGASTLNRCGLAVVHEGEAVSLRIELGEKGQTASHVLRWSDGQNHEHSSEAQQLCSICKLIAA